MVQRKLKSFGAKRKRTSTFGGRQKLFLSKHKRTFPARCAHRLVITPDQMLRKLAVEFVNVAEMFPVIRSTLCYDAFAGRYFHSGKSKIDRAVNELNHIIVGGFRKTERFL